MASNKKIIRYKPPGKVLAAFHECNDLVRIITGPIGSGKTTASVMEIMFRSLQATPCTDGVRRSRWLVTRSSYPELRSTTIKSWQQWIPEDVFGPIRWGSPITHNIQLASDCELEVLFMSLESDTDIKKVLSLELTGIYFNELGEGISRKVFEAALGRLKRFPSRQMLGGKTTWFGAIADTNMPASDHWLWELKETQPPGFSFFDQPPAVIRDRAGRWVLNPKAENLENLDPSYYRDMVAGRTKSWVQRFLACERVFLTDDKAVFGDSFNIDLHVVKAPAELPALPGANLVIGCDWGLTPAAVIGQIDSRGRIRVLDEVVGDNVGVQAFIETMLKPFLRMHYPNHRYFVVGDPAGRNRSQTDEKTVFDILREQQVTAFPAPTNSVLDRLEAVRWFLEKVIAGEPAIRINQRCEKLIASLAYGYRYKKVRTASEEVRYHMVPVKDKHSHVCFVAGTLVNTPDGERPIETLKAGDLVDTPIGPRRIVATGHREAEVVELEFSNGVTVKCTADHPFATQRGYVRADELVDSDLIAVRGDPLWNAQWKWLRRARKQSIPFTLSGVCGTTENLQGTTDVTPTVKIKRWTRIFTGRCGKPTSVRFLRGCTFITGMGTGGTIARRISNFFRRLSTPSSTWPILTAASVPELLSSSTEFQPPLNGESETLSAPVPWREGSGGSRGRTGHCFRGAASIAANRSAPRIPDRSSAHPTAARRFAGNLASTMSAGFAQCVAASLKSIVTALSRLAHRRAVTLTRRRPGNVSVVYNITVEDAHCYYVHGLLVSNCDALQYLCTWVRYSQQRKQTQPGRQDTRPVDDLVGV